VLLRVLGHAFLAEQLVAVEAIALIISVSVLSAYEHIQGPWLVFKQTLLVRLPWSWLLIRGYKLHSLEAVFTLCLAKEPC